MEFRQVLLVSVLAVFLAASVLAIPGMPHEFYGTVRINGNLAPEGTIITTQVNGVANSDTIVIENRYGWDPDYNYSSNPTHFFVTDPNGSNAGKTITFFVNGTQAGTAVFTNASDPIRLTHLDLGITDNSNNNNENNNNQSPGGGGPGGGGPSGGSSPTVQQLLVLDVNGSCLNERIIATVSRRDSNVLVEGATVTVKKDSNTVAQAVTPTNGKVSFILDETGEYAFRATRSSLVSQNVTVTVTDCEAQRQAEQRAQQEQDARDNANNNQNADDDLPEQPENPEQPGLSNTTAPTGFFGLGNTGAALIGLGILALLAILFVATRRKKK